MGLKRVLSFFLGLLSSFATFAQATSQPIDTAHEQLISIDRKISELQALSLRQMSHQNRISNNLSQGIVELKHGRESLGTQLQNVKDASDLQFGQINSRLNYSMALIGLMLILNLSFLVRIYRKVKIKRGASTNPNQKIQGEKEASQKDQQFEGDTSNPNALTTSTSAVKKNSAPPRISVSSITIEKALPIKITEPLTQVDPPSGKFFPAPPSVSLPSNFREIVAQKTKLVSEIQHIRIHTQG